MELALSSHWHGQFFTPYVLCEAMARMTYARDEIQRHVDEDGFVTVLEPACGAGAMAIGFAEVMREYGFVPDEHMHVVAIDVDATAAHMCFIQLALPSVPAAVHVGNSLSGEMREVFYTPAHILGAWSVRLWLRRLRTAATPQGSRTLPTPASAPGSRRSGSTTSSPKATRCPPAGCGSVRRARPGARGRWAAGAGALGGRGRGAADQHRAVRDRGAAEGRRDPGQGEDGEPGR
jgi:hypothetical protein